MLLQNEVKSRCEDEHTDFSEPFLGNGGNRQNPANQTRLIIGPMTIMLDTVILVDVNDLTSKRLLRYKKPKQDQKSPKETSLGKKT